MKHRIILRQDRYNQYQIAVQRKYWIWWGVLYIRRYNRHEAVRLAWALAAAYKCELINKI